MKKIYLLILFQLFLSKIHCQDTTRVTETIEIIDTIYEKKVVKVIDTIIEKELRVIQYDTLNLSIKHSQYNELFEKTLDQKQKHYDSALSKLQLIVEIIAIGLTLFAIFIGFFGYNSINSIRKNLSEKLNEESQAIKEKLKEESQSIKKKINTEVDEIVRLKYEAEITELKDKINNLERFSEEASNSFTVTRGKQRPKLNDVIKTPKSNKNPFDNK